MNKLALILLLLPSFTFAKWKEADFVNQFCQGKVEYRLADKSRVDCLTQTHAIEYDWGKKWAESIGQALFYAAETGRKAGVVLITTEKNKQRYLKRLYQTINKHNLPIDVWIIDKAKPALPIKVVKTS